MNAIRVPGPDHRGSLRTLRAARLLALLMASAVTTASCGDGPPPDAEADEHAGEEAAAGPPTVHLDEDAMALSGIRVGAADEARAGVLTVTGSITYDQNLVSHVGPKTEGRVVELNAEVGTRVREGQVLAHMESVEVGTTRADLHEAEALLSIARENYEREQRLEALGISSRRELLEAEAELRRVEAQLASATERLRVLGADTHGDGGHFDISSPYSGVVVEREGARGEVLGTDALMFTVADLSRLWIELDIYERDLSKVQAGLPVGVTTQAWPDRIFPGRIVYVGDILDPQRRTVRARVELTNEDGALKPGMFATARIGVAEGRSVAAVPRDAVQTVEGRPIVWVPGAEDGAFVARAVDLGEELPDSLVAILAGLDPGEPVVVEGAFTLKAQLSKGEFGGHGH